MKSTNYNNPPKIISLVCMSTVILCVGFFFFSKKSVPAETMQKPVIQDSIVTINYSIAHDMSQALDQSYKGRSIKAEDPTGGRIMSPRITVPKGAAAVEQTSQGKKPPARLVISFDGLGYGFKGPQGTSHVGLDNSLAVGKNYIVQLINSRMAIYTKKGAKFDSSGKVLYGPVQTRNVFRGFGGACEQQNNGDAVVRYDQLAHRWLIVMPIFSPIAPRIDRPVLISGDPARFSIGAQLATTRSESSLYIPPLDKSKRKPWPKRPESNRRRNSYAMCYAVSATSNPMGRYYRYEFVRQIFPDYPRPAVWPDGYYVPTSAGDGVIKKQICVAERKKMLKGEPATEQCVIIDGVNFLNAADLEGTQLPPKDAPEIVMAAGGTQLKGDFEDDGIYYWKIHVDWNDPSMTKLTGPTKVQVAPYHYLCDGQLTHCVSQPGTDVHLDSQGDKIMSRLVYRRIGDQQSIVGVHSVNTSSGGGGVRWYEFRINKQGNVNLYQQGTYAPDDNFRWLPSPAIDKFGNIGIGYSFGGSHHFVGQRFAGRTPNSPKGKLTLHETILVRGHGAQLGTNRWEDYTTTAIDPSDDCTMWYVGDYFKKGAPNHSTKIGAFRIPPCGEKK